MDTINPPYFAPLHKGRSFICYRDVNKAIEKHRELYGLRLMLKKAVKLENYTLTVDQMRDLNFRLKYGELEYQCLLDIGRPGRPGNDQRCPHLIRFILSADARTLVVHETHNHTGAQDKISFEKQNDSELTIIPLMKTSKETINARASLSPQEKLTLKIKKSQFSPHEMVVVGSERDAQEQLELRNSPEKPDESDCFVCPRQNISGKNKLSPKKSATPLSQILERLNQIANQNAVINGSSSTPTSAQFSSITVTPILQTEKQFTKIAPKPPGNSSGQFHRLSDQFPAHPRNKPQATNKSQTNIKPVLSEQQRIQPLIKVSNPDIEIIEIKSGLKASFPSPSVITRPPLHSSRFPSSSHVFRFPPPQPLRPSLSSPVFIPPNSNARPRLPLPPRPRFQPPITNFEKATPLPLPRPPRVANGQILPKCVKSTTASNVSANVVVHQNGPKGKHRKPTTVKTRIPLNGNAKKVKKSKVNKKNLQLIDFSEPLQFNTEMELTEKQQLAHNIMVRLMRVTCELPMTQFTHALDTLETLSDALKLKQRPEVTVDRNEQEEGNKLYHEDTDEYGDDGFGLTNEKCFTGSQSDENFDETQMMRKRVRHNSEVEYFTDNKVRHNKCK